MDETNNNIREKITSSSRLEAGLWLKWRDPLKHCSKFKGFPFDWRSGQALDRARNDVKKLLTVKLFFLKSHNQNITPVKKNQKDFFAIILLVVLVVAILTGGIFYFKPKNKKPLAILAGQTIKLELAQTQSEMATGLSNRDKLAPDAGMLFILGGDYIPSFWMKEMKFPIDIIFIKDNMVADFKKDAPAPSGEKALIIYRPKSFVNYVLEVNAGFVDKYGVKIGDRVEFKNLGL